MDDDDDEYMLNTVVLLEVRDESINRLWFYYRMPTLNGCLSPFVLVLFVVFDSDWDMHNSGSVLHFISVVA